MGNCPSYVLITYIPEAEYPKKQRSAKNQFECKKVGSLKICSHGHKKKRSLYFLWLLPRLQREVLNTSEHHFNVPKSFPWGHDTIFALIQQKQAIAPTTSTSWKCIITYQNPHALGPPFTKIQVPSQNQILSKLGAQLAKAIKKDDCSLNYHKLPQWIKVAEVQITMIQCDTMGDGHDQTDFSPPLSGLISYLVCNCLKHRNDDRLFKGVVYTKSKSIKHLLQLYRSLCLLQPSYHPLPSSSSSCHWLLPWAEWKIGLIKRGQQLPHSRTRDGIINCGVRIVLSHGRIQTLWEADWSCKSNRTHLARSWTALAFQQKWSLKDQSRSSFGR